MCRRCAIFSLAAALTLACGGNSSSDSGPGDGPGDGTGGLGGQSVTGGTGGLGGQSVTGGTGGLIATGGTGGATGLDPRCLAKEPTPWSACDLEDLGCTYRWTNGCLCEAQDMYNCVQVDPDCPSVSSDVAGFAPPAAATGGAQNTAPVPPIRLCACSGGYWDCTIYGI